MQTEPQRIQQKIVEYLSNVVNGVEIDLFATKQCTDESIKKSGGLRVRNLWKR